MLQDGTVNLGGRDASSASVHLTFELRMLLAFVRMVNGIFDLLLDNVSVEMSLSERLE